MTKLRAVALSTLAALVLTTTPSFAAPAFLTKIATKAKATQGWLKRNFTVRGQLRTDLSKAKGLARQGDYKKAANLLAKAKEPQGFVERIMVEHAQNKVFKKAYQGMRTRAMAGDITGRNEAQTALTKLQGKGNLTLLNRWRGARAPMWASRKAISVAQNSALRGNWEVAERNLNAAAKTLGKGNIKVAKANRNLFRAARTQGKAAAATGNIEGFQQAKAVAQDLAKRGGGSFNEAKWAKWEKASYKWAVPKELHRAEAAFKAGFVEEAAVAMARVRQIQTATGIKTGFTNRLLQKRLVRNIGESNIKKLEKELAKAVAQQ